MARGAKMRIKNFIGSTLVLVGLAAIAEPTVVVNQATTGNPWTILTVKYSLSGIDTDLDYKVVFDITANAVTRSVTNVAAKLINQSYTKVIDTVSLFGASVADPKAKVRVLLIAVKPRPKTDGDYMVINLVADAQGKYAVTYEDMTVSAANVKFNTDEYKTNKIVLKKVAADASYPCDPGNVLKTITKTIPVNKNYWIGLFEVTEAQYGCVMNEVNGVAKPKKAISYETIRGTTAETTSPTSLSFLGKLAANSVDAEGNAVTGFDLPTEAQWEIACRAGTTTKFCCGDSLLNTYALYETYGVDPRNVGMGLPNQWGLFDMHGNVDEWCRDAYTFNYSGTTAESVGLKEGAYASLRVRRGGGCSSDMGNCASSFRGNNPAGSEYYATGFRLCRTASK